jgi:hypothetical protein
MTLFGYLLLAMLAWGVLAFGAVYPWAYAPLGLAAAALGLWAIVKTRAWRDVRARTVMVALAVVAAAIALQIVPLPYEWFVRLSPGGDRLLRQLEFGYALQPPGWHALSTRPGATAVFLGIFVAFSLLLVGLMRAMTFLRIDWLVSQLMAFGIALALFGIIQDALVDKDAFRVYGFWTPQATATPFGPFINRNHFAGLMLLLIPLVAGYAGAIASAARKPRDVSLSAWLSWFVSPDAGRFAFATLAVVTMAAAVIASGSRSGMASFAVALAVFGGLAARRAPRRDARVAIWMYIAVLVIGALGWMGLEAAIERFRLAGTDVQDRLAAWRDTAAIIRDFPLAGTGFGAYGAAMLIYQTANRTSIFIHAHNEYLQILAEGGVLVAIPAIAAAVVLGRGIYRRVSRNDDDVLTGWVRLGAVAGLAGIAAQSTLEFSLQMPGNAAVCVLLIAIALHRPRLLLMEPDAHRV